MALFWRVWAAVIVVNLGVLALFVGLAVLQFDSINSGLVGERLTVLAGRTAAPFEAAAKIGLPLSTVRNANALLERARQTDDAISAIHVFDEAGRIVHSTDPLAPPSISPKALASRRAAAQNPWHLETAEGFLSGIDIPARDGSTAGGILVVYPTDASDTQIRAMGAELSVAAVLVMLIIAGLSIVLLRVSLRNQMRVFEEVENVIADFERVSWRSAAMAADEATPGADQSDDLRRLLDAAESRYCATGRVLAAAQERKQ